MLLFLDYFLSFFHWAFVIFVLVGWRFTSTRKSHRWALVLTASAWLIIGWYIGTIGYCPLTDWQWDIKRTLGEKNIPSSFIEYHVEKWTGHNFKKSLVDSFTAAGLIFAVLMAVIKSIPGKRNIKLSKLG